MFDKAEQGYIYSCMTKPWLQKEALRLKEENVRMKEILQNYQNCVATGCNMEATEGLEQDLHQLCGGSESEFRWQK